MISDQTNKTAAPDNFFRKLLTNRFSSIVIAVFLALAFTWIIIDLMNAQPLRVFSIMLKGSLGSSDAITQLLQAWVPLVLASCGLLFTFTAGLWNIGMEGQIEWGQSVLMVSFTT